MKKVVLGLFLSMLTFSMAAEAQWGRGGWGRGGRGGGHGGRMDQRQITCESNGYRYNECFVGGRVVNAYLVRQHSSASCVQGQSWGMRGNAIWVDRGCRATFNVTVRDRRFAPDLSAMNVETLSTEELVQPVQGYRTEVLCQSWDYQPASCYAGGYIMSANILDKKSNASCIQGSDWGYDGEYIWVRNGCRALFAVDLQ